MANDPRTHERRDQGFTLLEVLMVVFIVGVMAVVSFPAIASYVRNYRIRGAAQSLAGEVQSARSKAIMSNTNNGVSFVTVDVDSYRWIHEDLAGVEQFGPLKDLPIGIAFDAPATPVAASLRFQRLGGFCIPGVATCAPPVAVVCTAPEATRCGGAVGNYVGSEPGGGVVITLLEPNTQLRRTVRIAPGGRVLPQP